MRMHVCKAGSDELTATVDVPGVLGNRHRTEIPDSRYHAILNHQRLPGKRWKAFGQGQDGNVLDGEGRIGVDEVGQAEQARRQVG